MDSFARQHRGDIADQFVAKWRSAALTGRVQTLLAAELESEAAATRSVSPLPH